MDVLRDAEKTEKSTGVGSPTFRRLSAVKQVVEHVVDLVHHHGVLLVSGEHVLLHGAEEVQPEPPSAGAAAAGGAAAGGSSAGAGASLGVPPVAGLQHVDLTGRAGARGSTGSGASGSGADPAANARDDAELIKLLDSPQLAMNAE
ncbi:unnamed protein product, partial [Ectocarpus sp. 4 AP-2014]